MPKTNYQITNGGCLICSGKAKIENINDHEYYLCEKHNVMIDSNINQVMDDIGKMWSKLNLQDKNVERRNKLYDLLGDCKTIQFG